MIDIYGTDLDIYQVVNKVISKISIQFERAEEEIIAQLSRSKSIVPGSKEYEIALDELLRKKVGEPQK